MATLTPTSTDYRPTFAEDMYADLDNWDWDLTVQDPYWLTTAVAQDRDANAPPQAPESPRQDALYRHHGPDFDGMDFSLAGLMSSLDSDPSEYPPDHPDQQFPLTDMNADSRVGELQVQLRNTKEQVDRLSGLCDSLLKAMRDLVNHHMDQAALPLDDPLFEIREWLDLMATEQDNVIVPEDYEGPSEKRGKGET
ncbi:MAG: hypothetical protein M1814_000912 [Vezdaea aestivalis]|nr:MAG: hypothetical protein M1814_000912 [Vezdaea aestivalis]